MSWQRIDENTYIDDTLVTCAEYQLFIDEMREQGKYYQPDHWTSYQFPKGKALEAILGVSHSSAAAFCEWLTRREDGARKYRLPIQAEVNSFPAKSIEMSPIGYWIEKEYRFAWMGTMPKDARAIDLARACNFDFELDRYLASNPISPLPWLRESELARARESVRSRDRDRARNLAGFLELAHNLLGTPNISIVHNVELSQVLDLARSIARALDLNRALDQACNRALHLIRDSYFDRAFASTFDLDSDGDRATAICIDLLTLQERIAGRSPAFEGIRLVKERTK